MSQDLYLLLKIAHILGAALWAGPLIAVLWPIFRGADNNAITLLRLTGWPATAGLLVAGLSGLGLGYLRGFDWGVIVKIVVFLVLAASGVVGHYFVLKERRLLREGVMSGRTKAGLVFAIIITVVLIIMGTLLRFGLYI